MIRRYGTTTPVLFSGLSVGSKAVSGYSKQYVFELTFMIGDADGYPTETVVFNEGQEDEVVRFANFISRCMVAYPHGKGGYDNFEHIEDYARYIEDFEPEEECEQLHVLHWPMQDYEFYSSPNKMELYYYNESGTKFNVNLK